MLGRSWVKTEPLSSVLHTCPERSIVINPPSPRRSASRPPARSRAARCALPWAVELVLLVEPAWLSGRAPVSTAAFYRRMLAIAPGHTILDEMRSAGQASSGHRCKAQNKRGEPCSATIVGPGGYCTAHDPERKVDMRELGRAAGRARRRGISERLPDSERVSLVEAIRDGLDHDLVLAALRQALAGGNESARVAAVRLLADLSPYRKNDDEESDAERAARRQQMEE